MSDGDGFGNRCAPNLSNDLIVNILDFPLLSERFLSSNAEADYIGGGVVNVIEFAIFADFFLLPLGPGASGQS